MYLSNLGYIYVFLNLILKRHFLWISAYDCSLELINNTVHFQEILFCQVIWPSDASPESMELPSILSKFQVHEVLVRRWISSQEREESDVS